MRQCQLMLEDNGKSNLKNLYLLDLKIWGLKRCSFDLIYFKYILKKILTTYLSFTSQWHNNSERL
jgi:hypothetical protein